MISYKACYHKVHCNAIIYYLLMYLFLVSEKPLSQVKNTTIKW